MGPGTPWKDALLAVSPGQFDWTFCRHGALGEMKSRCDLIITNSAALCMIESVVVVAEHRIGGHAPVVARLRTEGMSIDWWPGRAALPEVLRQPRLLLEGSAEWDALVCKWRVSEAGKAALEPPAELGAGAYWMLLRDALLHLVVLAGGWRESKPHRRAAYESNVVRRLRRQVGLLWKMKSMFMKMDTATCAGPWPYSLHRIAGELRTLVVSGLDVPLVRLGKALSDNIQYINGKIRKVAAEERAERLQRWKDSLPRLWHDSPGVVYRWAFLSVGKGRCTTMGYNSGA